MNFLKFAALSLVMLSSLVSAKIAVEAAIADSTGMLMIPAMNLELNKVEEQFVGNLRFEAMLTEKNTVVFNLSVKDEAGNFVSFLQPELVLVPEETKASLEFADRDGNQFVLIVHANEIQE
jgi:hypothetical protein